MIVGVLQARTSSRRLPRKVLADVVGAPMLVRQSERLRRATRIERLVVATTVLPDDDAVVDACSSAGLEFYRGSLDDVLQRVLDAAGDAEHIVRLTADCPLADPALVDRVIEVHLEGGHDYTSNTLRRTYPDGLDVEVARRSALVTAARSTSAAYDREHVTPYLYLQPEQFDLGTVTDNVDRSSLRWTVDEPADLVFVREVYRELFPGNPAFTTADVHALLQRRPDLDRSRPAEARS